MKFGKGVTSIGKNAFYFCSKLTQINIPNSVVSIGETAFSFCDLLESISLPNNITSIQKDMFWACDDLKYLAIPSSVTSIKEYALRYCRSLNGIYCLSATPPTIENILIDTKDISGITLYVPAGTVAAYKNAYGWKDFPRIEEINPDEISDINCLRTIAKSGSGSGSGLKGDVNGDNEVNISDVSALVNVLLKK